MVSILVGDPIFEAVFRAILAIQNDGDPSELTGKKLDHVLTKSCELNDRAVFDPKAKQDKMKLFGMKLVQDRARRSRHVSSFSQTRYATTQILADVMTGGPKRQKTGMINDRSR